MHIDEIKSLIKRVPFKAFTLVTPNLKFTVLSPDHIAVNPFTGEIHLFTQGQVIYVASDGVSVMADGELAV